MLTITIGSISTLLAIYLTAFWLLTRILSDYQGVEKKGNKSLLRASILLFGLVLGLELVGFLLT